jgi:phage tail sheath protein FI
VLTLQSNPSDSDQSVLNPLGVNVIRAFPGRGVVVYGARTLSSEVAWQYISVRRLFSWAERSIGNAVRPYLFRTNDDLLWSRMKNAIDDFLRGVWQDRGLFGESESAAWFVRLDETTTTDSDILNGRAVGIVGMRPSRPAEFLIFRFGQFDGTPISEGG